MEELVQEPQTKHEKQLLLDLENSKCVISLQKDIMIGMQAQTILQAMYVEDICGQLQGNDEKKAKAKNKGKLNMDGRAKILTQDQIFEAVKEAGRLWVFQLGRIQVVGNMGIPS